jgi:hypothetical protein
VAQPILQKGLKVVELVGAEGWHRTGMEVSGSAGTTGPVCVERGP